MITTNPLPSFLRGSTQLFGKRFFLFHVLLVFFSVNALAQPVNIVINPQATNRNVGQTFTILVATDFIGNTPPPGVDDIEIHLAFDNTKLLVTSITEEPVVSAFTAKPIPLEAAPYTTTNAMGQVNYAATTTAGIPTTDFNVLSITFQVIGGDGTSTALTLRRDPPTNETRSAMSGTPNLANVVNGTVTINAVGCTTPVATISTQAGATICDAQPFNLILSTAPAGTAPFDLTISGPTGTATYNDIVVGGVITSFTPPVERIWPAAPAPLPPTVIDAAVTLGVKFRSSVSGFVKGVRFFSPDEVSAVPGDYTGQLWTASGTLLASGTFTGLTTDSWQELTFTSPVLIDANTTYVASYHTNGIKYVSTANGLAAAVTNGSLTAPDNATAGGNGVYAYGGAVAFPNNSFNAANYWVDVIFSPNNYTFTLTGVKDANECADAGALQTLNVTSVDCSSLPVNIIVSPQTTTTTVGQSFTVLVAADFTGASPAGVDDVEVHLSFDNTKLAVTAITEEPVVSAFTSKPIPLEAAPYTTTNATGQVNYAATTTTGIPTSDFNILSITFQVIGGDGTSTPLTLRRDPPANDTRAAGSGSSVLSTVINGTVIINAAGCITPTATISAPGGGVTCNGQSFNLILASSPAPVGTAPFDLTITGPTGTATYNDIAVGGIITNFTPPTESIWPAAPSPLPPTNIDAAVTLGVKFRSSVSGFVKGVRFFSPDQVSLVPGDYTGQLWTASGTLLASGTFTGVTTDSWQELIFTSPVLIAANTTYIASYHTNSIRYVNTATGLTSSVTNGSLTALDDVTAGGNGVYAYGAAVTFPGNSFNAANYWVDVLFSPNAYTFNLTGVKDANECSNAGALQTLNVNSADCSTLPVTLLNFSATPGDNVIYLNWATATEINNLGFEIQRSSNGSSWSVVGFVNGAGNSTGTIKYSFADGNLAAGKYYYRLRQVDLDQRFVYSAIVSAALGSKGSFSLEQNYPNPVRNETIVRFTLPQKSTVNLSLYDMNGRLVRVLVNENKEQGTHAINVQAGALVAGLYYYKLQAGDLSAVKKMTIQ